MTRESYRVECNFGSKYFASNKQAFIYFNYRKAQGYAVEIWLVKRETTKTLFSVSQILIDYAPKS